MAKNWHCNYDIETFKGRHIKRSARVADPAKHFAEYLKRFHPAAKKITWWPTDHTHTKELGPRRWVEFDTSGKVVSRGPDIDIAHVGGQDWKPDPNNPNHDVSKGGESRKGVDPTEDKDLGRHPNFNYEDEEQVEEAPPSSSEEVPPPANEEILPSSGEGDESIADEDAAKTSEET